MVVGLQDQHRSLADRFVEEFDPARVDPWHSRLLLLGIPQSDAASPSRRALC